MKRFLIGALVVVLAIGAVGFLFREPLLQAVFDRLTANMFVDADTDAYDPGPPLGDRLPPIAARFDGRTIRDLTEFTGENGVVLFAVRSVEW